MALFKLSVDDVLEELFHELEKQSDGGRSHFCEIEAESKDHAAEILCKRLHPFFTREFDLC